MAPIRGNNHELTSTLHSLFLLNTALSIFLIISPTLAQVPLKETFKFINQGEFGDLITEYDASYRVIGSAEYGASYRVIRTNASTFSTFPFQLCFYNTTPNAYVLGIRAGVPNDDSLMRWVWDANRKNPVREKAQLSLGTDGNLVLAQGDGQVVWQTNTANKGVTGIKLLNNGNLVLHDKNGSFVWQSFDYPTDTLLIGQSIKVGGTNKLVSRKSEVDGSDGPYSLILDKKGFVMYLHTAARQLVYGGWVAKNYGSTVTFTVEPDSYFGDELRLDVAQDTTSGGQRRLLQTRPVGGGHLKRVLYNATYSILRLGIDGNLRAFTYNDNVASNRWEETYGFFSDYNIRECGLPSKCGTFGLCDRKMCIACPSQKGLLGWSKACSPPTVPTCKGSAGVAIEYYKIAEAEHFLSPYNKGEAGPMKVSECKDKCSKDCKCLGFVYKEDTSMCLVAPVLATLIKAENTSAVYVKYSK